MGKGKEKFWKYTLVVITTFLFPHEFKPNQVEIVNLSKFVFKTLSYVSRTLRKQRQSNEIMKLNKNVIFLVLSKVNVLNLFSLDYKVVLIFQGPIITFLYNPIFLKSYEKLFSTMFNSWSYIFQVLKIGEHQLVLQRVTLQSSGIYSCQITLSGPPFDTVNKEKSLSVYGKSWVYIYGKSIQMET